MAPIQARTRTNPYLITRWPAVSSLSLVLAALEMSSAPSASVSYDICPPVRSINADVYWAGEIGVRSSLIGPTCQGLLCARRFIKHGLQSCFKLGSVARADDRLADAAFPVNNVRSRQTSNSSEFSLHTLAAKQHGVVLLNVFLKAPDASRRVVPGNADDTEAAHLEITLEAA